MTIIGDPEYEARREAEIKELAKRFLPNPPPPAPNLTLITEGELSSATLRQRIEHDQRLLRIAERREERKRKEAAVARSKEERRKVEEDWRKDCQRYGGEAGAATVLAGRQARDWMARGGRTERGED
jgi:hypothetical protein